MKVYVVMTGCYEQTWVGGVFSSPEAAMGAFKPRPAERGVPGSVERPGGWQYDKESHTWSSGLDWDEFASIHEYEVDAS